MTAAPALPLWGLALLEAAAFADLCLQVLHAVTAASMRPRGRRLPAVAAGACAVLHLSLAADMLAALDWQASPFLAESLAAAGMLPLLWANLPLACALAALACPLGDRLLLAEGALALTALPPVAAALGGWWNLAAALDLCGFLAAGAAQLLRDLRRRWAGPTDASVAEAMNAISVGMLVTDGRGGSAFMNDAMRSQLEGLGFPTDLGDLSHVWEEARARAVTLEDLGVSGEEGGPLGAGSPWGGGSSTADAGPFPSASDAGRDRMLVRAGDGRVLLAALERPRDGRGGTRAFSLDVTRLVEAAQRLSSANDALEEANAELGAQLADVQAVARQAAFLRMRAAVHDVIGQRLSILQRYLDAGKVDEGSAARLRALMDSILRDLREASGADPAESLEDVVDAFALVDVDVVVEGDLPDSQPVSNALVRVVREACTNACRHAQARTVWVELGSARDEDGEDGEDGGAWATLEVHDDGAPGGDVPAGGAVREGTGIPGMRRAVEELGGELAVSPGPPFSVSARVPLRRGGEEARHA